MASKKGALALDSLEPVGDEPLTDCVVLYHTEVADTVELVAYDSQGEIRERRRAKLRRVTQSLVDGMCVRLLMQV